MSRLLRYLRFVVVFLGFATSPSWAGAPGGVYEGPLGLLEMRVQGQKVVGYSVQDGGCLLGERRRVLEGTLEGTALLGKVLVCQSGPACEDKFFDLMAFYNSKDDAWVGEVKLDPGCASAGLSDGRRVSLRRVLDPPSAPKLLAQAERRNAALALRYFRQADEQLRRQHFERAVHAYRMGLSYDEHNWAAFLNLGVAETRLGDYDAAIDALEQARMLSPKSQDAHYNLACAYARKGDKSQALSMLRQSLRLGFSGEGMGEDADLASLQGDPDFERLLAQRSAPSPQ